jgi:hypothetical protein
MVRTSAGNPRMKFSLGFTLFALSALSYAQTISNGLVAHYTFEGNADDVSGNRNNATPAGVYEYLANGLSGKALRISGDGSLVYSSGGYVELPTFDVTLNNGFTISLWVKDEVLGGQPSNEESYISFGVVDNPGCGISYNSVTRRIIYYISGGGPGGGGDIQLPLTVSAGEAGWKHLAITYAPGHFAAYYNGGKVAEPFFTVNAFPVTRAAIGRHWWSGGAASSARMSVTIDNVRIYKRALSDAEMGQLYLAESAPPVVTPPIVVPSVAPAITTQPTAQTIIEQQSVTFRVSTAGSAPFTYQWLKNGSPIAGGTDASFMISAVAPSDAGTYSVSVLNAAGFVLSSPAPLTVVPANPGKLVNLSVLGTGGFTAGFAVGGGTTKAVLLRAVGPTLTRFGVENPATTTRLTLYSGASILAQNSGWSAAFNAAQIAGVGGAFALNAGSADSAILMVLAPGTYTAQVVANGPVLLEVYEVP